MAHWRSGILVLLAGVGLAGCSPLWQGALQGIADGARSPERLLVRNAPAELPNLLYVEGEGRAAVHVGVVSPQDPDLYWWAAPDGVTLSLRGGRWWRLTDCPATCADCAGRVSRHRRCCPSLR